MPFLVPLTQLDGPEAILPRNRAAALSMRIDVDLTEIRTSISEIERVLRENLSTRIVETMEAHFIDGVTVRTRAELTARKIRRRVRALRAIVVTGSVA